MGKTIFSESRNFLPRSILFNQNIFSKTTISTSFSSRRITKLGTRLPTNKARYDFGYVV